MQRALHHGDNLDVLRRRVADESVDLVYLDPPFKSDQHYQAFDDTWAWSAAAAAAYDETVAAGGAVADALAALRLLLGARGMLAYLAAMAPRLLELRRVLKASGSIYLHCDPGASHSLKLLMDAVFGAGGFRNEIVWCYRKWSVTARQFARNHDVILFYTKAHGGGHVFNPLHVPVSAGTRRRWKGRRQQARFEDGVRKAGSLADVASRSPMADWWEISVLNPNAAERLDYPTQKPEALLERIVRASSRAGDVVLDPCCGSGTTLVVAERLGRAWIGIDASARAIAVSARRIADGFGGRVPYTVEGDRHAAAPGVVASRGTPARRAAQTTRVARRSAISDGA